MKGPGRKNTILMHPERKTIIKQIILGEQGLPGGMSKAQVAKRLGMHPDSIVRFRKEHITEEMVRATLAEVRISKIEGDTAVLNEDRMDVARTYESLAKRVEKIIARAEENEDDGFTLSAAEGLRRILRDIATMHGKMATSLTVEVKLSESAEWVTLKRIIREVCDEVPEAREPFLRKMRREALSITREGSNAI
ncbi:hypothetical protein E2L08_12520 [Palleronia sediminis]|uniref:Uncharacterized protein n=1 Tax=Palleronia sediminis TaxID=2547833 RepID=A0A4R6A611_9RHOB|nr:hypothetical protein [Palleronia sediminis]TDL78117.1 hypothetical protein E2L08_12520 [Palleronia sediminis]